MIRFHITGHHSEFDYSLRYCMLARLIVWKFDRFFSKVPQILNYTLNPAYGGQNVNITEWPILSSAHGFWPRHNTAFPQRVEYYNGYTTSFSRAIESTGLVFETRSRLELYEWWFNFP